MIEAGWYPDPRNESGLRYWDGKSWTDRTQKNPESDTAGEGFSPKREDVEEMRLMLQHGGYNTEPDFILWGTSSEFEKATALTARLAGEGRKLYAVAAYPNFMVHAIGRLKSRKPGKLRGSDEVNLSEIGYSEVVSVHRSPGFENLICEYVLDTGQGRNILTDALFGKGYRIHLTRKQENSQAEKIEEIKNRVRDSKNGNKPTGDVADIAGQLEKLASLHQSGVISESDFEAAKKKLLS